MRPYKIVNTLANWCSAVSNGMNEIDQRSTANTLRLQVLFTSQVNQYENVYSVVHRLSSFRVFVSVTAINHFRFADVLVNTLTRAGKHLLMAALLTSFVAYVYAVFGVALFDYSTIAYVSINKLYLQIT